MLCGLTCRTASVHHATNPAVEMLTNVVVRNQLHLEMQRSICDVLTQHELLGSDLLHPSQDLVSGDILQEYRLPSHFHHTQLQHTSARVLSLAMRPGQPLMTPSSCGGTLLVKKMCAVPYVGLPDQSCSKTTGRDDEVHVCRCESIRPHLNVLL